MLDLAIGVLVLAAFLSGGALGFGVAVERWARYRESEIQLLRALMDELRGDGLDSQMLRLVRQSWKVDGELRRAEWLRKLMEDR